MRLYNSLSRRVEEFNPINPPKVGMYTCGPTVYWSTHVGHVSKYVGDDLLRRTLTYLGYQVNHVMNVTDVGHLVSDEDSGEDKMEKGAVREGKSVWEIAKKYEIEFFDTMDQVNVLRPNVVARATEHIAEQIELIKRLEHKGFTYETEGAVYYNVAKFPDYGKLSGQKLGDKKTGARSEVVVDPEKINREDFVLWFKCVGRFQNHVMRWESPWGVGFPGWHIECSAMSMKYLGESFDIHTGGIDHIGVHHPAEMAQSEGATGKPFVKYWVHRVFILVDGKKMSKSLGNFYTLEDVKNKGYQPMALRYLFLTGHYRAPQNFTWEALQGAQKALDNLVNQVNRFRDDEERVMLSPEKLQKVEQYRKRFVEAISEDLNFPQTLAIAWEVVKSNIPNRDKYDLLLEFNQVWGLGLTEPVNKQDRVLSNNLSPELKALVEKRETYRKQRKFLEADQIRIEISQMGYALEDSPGGLIIRKHS